MEIKEIRQKAKAELEKLLKMTREQVRDLRFKISAKQHKDVRDLREAKRTVARILTVLKEKRIVDQLKARQDKHLDNKAHENKK